MFVYILLEHYDNGLSWEDHYSYDEILGVYKSESVAREQINKIAKVPGRYVANEKNVHSHYSVKATTVLRCNEKDEDGEVDSYVLRMSWSYYILKRKVKE